VPLTSNCDFYVAIYDAGINRVVKQVMQQRPSLFNYGTALLADNPQLLCTPIDADPRVILADNPLITVLGPLPVLGTSDGLNFCVQASLGEIDFYPSNVITLPPDLNPPLPAQQLAVYFRVCAGIGCPSHRSIPVWPPVPSPSPVHALGASALADASPGRRAIANPIGRGPIILPPSQGITVLPTDELDCFCLDLFATGGCTITGAVGSQRILPSVSGIDIPELEPAGMEKSLECYALVALNQGILPQLGGSISQIAFGLMSLPGGMGSLQLSASTAVPNNPAIQDNQLEVFIDLDQIDLNITVSSGGGGSGGSGGGGGGTVTRTTRPRTRTGPFDLTAAVSADAFTKIFAAFVNGFKFSTSGSGSEGPFSVSYTVACHLEGGSISLTSSGGIEVKDVVVKWDTLSLTMGFTIPNVCTPGFCLIPDPFGGCAVEVPSLCIFSTPPELSVSLDVGGFLDSKVTFTGIPRVYYGVGSGTYNRWQIAVEPTLPIYLEIVDIADTAGDLFQSLIVDAIDNLISGLPGWAQDLINDVLGGVEDIIRDVLGIPDDIGEWIVDMISDLHIFQELVDALSKYISLTVFEVPDPYTVLPAENGLIPVELPIQYIGINVSTSEMEIGGDIGD
jgi:hypothetical protein